MDYMGPGFGGFFGGAPPIFALMFFLVFGIIIFTIIMGIVSTVKNATSPIITVEAKVVTKRTDVRRRHHNTGVNNSVHHTSSTYYYVTFETEHGERLELPVSGRMYGMLVEGDEGKLTYQGSWFKDFKRFNSPLE
jgi:hypothetical protein